MTDPIPLLATNWAELDTPCYVFDEPELRANFDDFTAALRGAWSPLARVAYSVKTNHLPWILQVAREQGCMAEVVSGDEFDLALACGFSPADVIFNGPIKTRDWLDFALAGGSIINLDSAGDVVWACERARAGAQVSVGVRVNVDVERFCPGETVTGEAGGRFGFCRENGELDRVIDDLVAAGVRVAGLHMHVTTRSRSQRVYEVLASQAAQVVREHGLEPDFIDIGGGFYGGGKRNEGAYEAYAATIARELREAVDPARCALYVEPGGAVVCTPGRYAGKVVDRKDTNHGRFVTCELSRINIDHEMKKTSYPLHLLSANGTHELTVCPDGSAAEHPSSARPALDRQVLCGYTCMESDRLCVLEGAPELAVGDVVVIDFAGAYSMCFTPEMFIEYPPAVYARNADGSCRLVRPTQRRRPPAAPEPDKGDAATARDGRA